MGSTSTSSSSTDKPVDAPTPAARLQVGHIGKAHGLRGEVNVRLTTDRVERVAVGSCLSTGDIDLVVASARVHQSGYIVAFDDVTTREAAEALRGLPLYADAIDDPQALWVHDLIGSRIEEIDGTPRGIVESVQENPASDLLVTSEGALVPLTFYVERRDGVIVIDPPTGLFGEPT